MASFHIDTEKVINSSQEIISIAVRLKGVQNKLESIKSARILGGLSEINIDKSLKKHIESILEEAAKMDSFGDALQEIVTQYKKTEMLIESMECKGEEENNFSKESSKSGKDKRGWWSKFWDWITGDEPDEYDMTTEEQEKAADEAMKKQLWQVLQDEKYSPENWDNSSIEERKKILQDYMNEVIKIYGLKDVNPNIVWDSNATYTENKITWGSYNDSSRKVKLNVNALTDSVGNWDSYNLLATVSHELRHAYQHEAMRHPTRYMVSKETLDKWRQRYISPSENYDAYRAQPVEVDAREFEVSRDDRI